MVRRSVFLAVLFFAGCSGKKESPVVVVANSEKDAGTPKIDVPELLKHHERFRGREVELTGWADRSGKTIHFSSGKRYLRCYPHQEYMKKFLDNLEDHFTMSAARRREIVILATVGTEDAEGVIRLHDCRFVKLAPQPE